MAPIVYKMRGNILGCFNEGKDRGSKSIVKGIYIKRKNGKRTTKKEAGDVIENNMRGGVKPGIHHRL